MSNILDREVNCCNTWNMPRADKLYRCELDFSEEGVQIRAVFKSPTAFICGGRYRVTIEEVSEFRNNFWPFVFAGEHI